jgi:acyl carrier protein
MNKIDSELIGLISTILAVSPDELTIESGPGTLPLWDSLGHVTIIAAVEETYGIKLKMLEILNVKTIGDLQKIINLYHE